MENNLKIGTWNLCLGLANKKDTVTDYLKANGISICCLQETEIPANYPENILNYNDYVLELESSASKKRAGIYLEKNIVYKRRGDLEKNNCHIVIVDVTCTEPVRIINIYRSFHPPDGSSQSSFFAKQLEIIKNAICRNCFVMGDFNLEGGNNLRPDYQNKLLLNTLKNFTTENYNTPRSAR